MTSKKPKPKPSTTRGKSASRLGSPRTKGQSIAARSLSLIKDTDKPIRLRLPIAVALLATHAEAAIAALNSMAKDGACSDKHFARITRALSRHESRTPKEITKRRPDASAKMSPKVDLSGPHTMQIAMDPELDAEWHRLHADDPATIYERRKLAVKTAVPSLPLKIWDDLNHLPFEERNQRLDEILKEFAK